MQTQELTERVLDAVDEALVGVRDPVRLLVTALVCEGHVLLEDVPGTGKTAGVRAVAAVTGLDFGRVQCTPDLLPTEITGVNVFRPSAAAEPGAGDFEFRPGPVFTSLLLVDEINRATPRSQSALLEAMAEGQVTVDGTPHALPRPFLVAATQNPIEHAGTFPLPEAQMDRFMLSVAMGYPARDAQRRIFAVHRGGEPLDRLRPVVDPGALPRVWDEIAAVHVDDAVEGYLLDIVEATRTHDDVDLGVSVRGALMLEHAARAHAAMDGRDYALPDDVKQLCGPVLGHRLALTQRAQWHGRSTGDVVAEILGHVPVPALERD